MEWTPYPLECSYLSPGSWHHVVVGYADKHTTVLVDGAPCAAYKGGGGALSHGSHDLKFGDFAGALADVRVYARPPPAAEATAQSQQ